MHRENQTVVKWENRKSRAGRELASDIGMSNYDLSRGRLYQELHKLGYLWDAEKQEWRRRKNGLKVEGELESLKATIASYERIMRDAAEELDALGVPENVGTMEKPETHIHRRLAWLRAMLEKRPFIRK